MKPPRLVPLTIFTSLFALFLAVCAHAATNTDSGVQTKARHVAQKTGDAIDKGAKKTKQGINKAAVHTEHALHTAAEKTESALQKTGNKIEAAIKK